MALDTTFDFEKRRNRAVKYDRELMSSTLHAIQRVTEIKERREQQFFTNRMKDVKGKEKQQARIELQQNIELIRPAAASLLETNAQLNITDTERQAQRVAAPESMVMG